MVSRLSPCSQIMLDSLTELLIPEPADAYVFDSSVKKEPFPQDPFDLLKQSCETGKFPCGLLATGGAMRCCPCLFLSMLYVRLGCALERYAFRRPV